MPSITYSDRYIKYSKYSSIQYVYVQTSSKPSTSSLLNKVGTSPIARMLFSVSNISLFSKSSA